MGSRGSVIPLFLNQAKENRKLPITVENMTRFNISLSESVSMVIWALDNSFGGEILVPKIPSYKIMDLAEAIGPGCEKIITGIRPGEKIHEELVTSSDSSTTIELENYYVILGHNNRIKDLYRKTKQYTGNVKEGFSYNSENNENCVKTDFED